jgi:ribose transport system substrate-binding protein
MAGRLSGNQRRRTTVRLSNFRAAHLALIALLAGILLSGTSCNKNKTAPATETTHTIGDKTIHFFKVSDPNNLKLAFVVNTASEFWTIAAAGIHKYEKENNVQVDIKTPNQGKAEDQNKILENLTSQGYNGIALSVIAPDDQVSEINKAAETTNIFCFDSDCVKSNRILYIGTDNFHAGRMLGQEILKLLPHGGKIAIFVGTLAADNAKQRLAGIVDAIKDHNIDIVAKKEDGMDRNKARTNVENVITDYHDLNLVCGLWSYNGPAIADAIEASGKKGKILAAVFDQEQGTLDGIKKGDINCACVQNPFQIGYLSSKWLHDLAVQGDAVKLPEGGSIDTGANIINAGNIDEYTKQLTDLLAGSK